MTAVNDIWAQAGINFEIVYTETFQAGDAGIGDIDRAPTGNFPSPEDTDVNGNGIFEPMDTVDINERKSLQTYL